MADDKSGPGRCGVGLGPLPDCSQVGLQTRVRIRMLVAVILTSHVGFGAPPTAEPIIRITVIRFGQFGDDGEPLTHPSAAATTVDAGGQHTPMGWQCGCVGSVKSGRFVFNQHKKPNVAITPVVAKAGGDGPYHTAT